MDSPVLVTADRGDAPLVALGGQYAVPRTFTATVTPEDDTLPICHLLIAVKDGRPTCQALTLEAGPSCHQINGAVLRGVRLADYVSQAIDAVALWVIPADDPSAPVIVNAPGWEPQQLRSEPFDEQHVAVRVVRTSRVASVKAALRPRREAGAVTDEMLREVADVYRSAHNARKAPTKAVMEEWHVARSTASRWIKRARNAGHLGAAQPRKAGEI